MAAVRRLRGRETHQSGGLSNAQYSLLFSLLQHPELSSRELADQADLTAATVTQMLEALESDGFVARVRSESDRRIVLTSLTRRGQELCGSRRAEMEPRWRAALSSFSDEELLTAARVLEQLAAFFDEMPARS
jgi:DNA-binding MarR family transcriptional regulator